MQYIHLGRRNIPIMQEVPPSQHPHATQAGAPGHDDRQGHLDLNMYRHEKPASSDVVSTGEAMTFAACQAKSLYVVVPSTHLPDSLLLKHFQSFLSFLS